MKFIDGGVTAAKGFQAASAAAGIKYTGRTDMAMVYSDKPCAAAGTFTRNVVKAAPVKWDQHIVHDLGTAQAVICNSGIANACTGQEGMDYCSQTADRASARLGIPADSVLVASTGVIGMQLNIDRVCAGVDMLSASLADSIEAGHQAARAIMTTDTQPKEVAVEFEVGGRRAVIGGMCKGSGMIHPNMCTMLCFITTDAAISQEMLQKALSASVEESFNMISVDGDTSTNDTCILLANGLAGNSEITEEDSDFQAFCEGLDFVTRWLARHMAADGEGATALLEAKVIGAESRAQAKVLAKSIITSNLVKTAIAGHDANWGRVLCAMGYSGASFDPEKVDLYFESAAGKIKIIGDGVDTGYSEEEATKILSEKEITVTADIKMGQESATAWGCDLTHGYISINADYRS